jgi:hypothetical protein
LVLGATCGVGALTLAAARSAGQPAAGAALLELDWDAPNGCPSKEVVRGRIDELLQGPPTIRTVVFARATRVGAHDWRMVVATRVGSASGERTLRASSCRELADATALVVALAIDPERVAAYEAHASGERSDASAAPPSPGVDAAPPPEAAAARSSSVEPPPAPKAHTAPPSVFVGERTVIGLGVAPGIAGGASLVLGWERGPWQLDLAGAAWSPRRQSLDGAPSVGGRFTSYEGALRACVRIAQAKAQPFACAGAEVALLEARGYGVDHPSSSARSWIGPSAGLAFAWAFAPSWRLALDVSGAVPLMRPPFVIDAERTIYRPAAASFEGGLGLDLLLF